MVRGDARTRRLEHGLIVGGAVILAGAVLGAGVLAIWARGGFGTLAEQRVILLAGTLVVVGVQICFSSFLLSILGLRR